MKKFTFIFLLFFSLLGLGQAQEIPNGDGDLLWDRSLIVDGISRTVNDAKFHPINGNIIAAVNHEIWEIDPKDGHTIRVFEGGYPADASDLIRTINITTDGQKIVTGGAMGKKGILIWDYNTGFVTKIISKNEIFDVYENIGIYPDNNRIIFNTYQDEYGSPHNTMSINIYNLALDSIKRVGYLYDTYCARFKMSENGQFIAYGFAKGDLGNFSYTMELWDAETLTKIKDFGELPGFIDIQISIDNQYIASIGLDKQFSIFSISSGTLLKQSIIASFRFLNEGNKIIIDDNPSFENKVLNIIRLPEFDTLYNYHLRGSKIRINKQNEIFSVGFDTTLGAKTQFFSNKWYEVGVDEPKLLENPIFPNPATDYITVILPPLEKRGQGGVLLPIQIYDVFGNKVLTAITDANMQINVSALPTGTYFLRTGSEVYKFMVVR